MPVGVNVTLSASPLLYMYASPGLVGVGRLAAVSQAPSQLILPSVIPSYPTYTVPGWPPATEMILRNFGPIGSDPSGRYPYGRRPSAMVNRSKAAAPGRSR